MTEYWDAWYSKGGTSGLGSVGKSREWKWKHILTHAGAIDEVIDVGCGDLRFWDGRDCKNYVGIDASSAVIKRGKTERPNWKFVVQDAQIPVEGITARVVFCLDVLFHILDDSTYVRILENLCQYSKEWIFIVTWTRNPFDFRWRLKTLLFDLAEIVLRKHSSRFSGLSDRVRFLLKERDSDALYQKYRDFPKYISVLQKAGFAVVAFYAMPAKVDRYQVNALYVFQKKPKILPPF